MSSSRSHDQQLIIQDISTFGIRGKAKRAPDVGETVCVKLLDGQVVYLEVRWVNGNVFGAQANSPINLAQIGID